MAEADDFGVMPEHGAWRTAAGHRRRAGALASCVAACLAGSGVISIALASQAFSQSERTSSPSAAVTSVVRNDFGQLKWVATEATDYTPLEKAGRQIYVEARCSYCHAQYSKPRADAENRWSPISDDKRRWGPAVEPGEYAHDNPTQFGSPGIAPDLGRVGLKYGNEWHLAHFYDPPSVVKGSIMGGFSGLFDELAGPIKIVTAEAGKTLEQTPETAKLFDFASKEQVKLTPNERGVLFVPVSAKGKYPLVWTPNDEYAGDSVKLVAESDKIHALTAYVQKLGTNRGRWRELVEPDHIEGADTDAPRSDEAIAKGKVVYERRCLGCHGAKGDGNGEAAAFMNRQRPRNFTTGVFKFRLTTTGTLPSDRDLLRTISRGVRGTAMPAWYELPLEDRLAVIQYIKYELSADRSDANNPYFYFVEEPPGALLEIAAPPKPSPELNSRGKEIFLQAKCWECHGKTGKGDGEKAGGLKDDWSFPIRPADLTTGQFKSGPTVADIFRTISIGLSGSPMPSFQASFPEADRWALAYYILSLSAFTDPLTAAPLPISDADRAALNNLDLHTPGPEQAYKLSRPVKTSKTSQPTGAAEKSSALDAAKGKAFSQN